MKSLYVKFALTTISIMLVSGLLAFMFSNFYYQQKLKPENDAKNTRIALEIVDYLGEEPDTRLDHYLENIAAIDYQMALIDENGQETYFGDPFREKELSDKSIGKVLEGNVYHGIAEFPHETFVTGFFANELTNTIGVPLGHDNTQQELSIRRHDEW